MRKKYLLTSLAAIVFALALASPALAGIKLGVEVASGDAGVVILKIDNKKGYGAKLGLRAGDEITGIRINADVNRRIRTVSNLLWSLGNTRDKITVTWLRNGKRYSNTLYRPVRVAERIVNGQRVQEEVYEDFFVPEGDPEECDPDD